MAAAAALQQLQLPLASSIFFQRHSNQNQHHSFSTTTGISTSSSKPYLCHHHNKRNIGRRVVVVLVGKEESINTELLDFDEGDDEELDEGEEPQPEDMEYIAEIKRVLGLLKKNRDMMFSEVKLTIMIEDPREVERRRLLGIEDPDAPTREELANALELVNEGKVPKDRLTLKLLAEEMAQWPNLEVEPIKKKPKKSLYARFTDTGINPEVAAKKLNIDWDSAAEIDETDVSDETEVPSAVGYGALYLVSGFPIIIGISVVLILFYNSLQ